MTTARIERNWLVVPYSGPRLATVHIATGRKEPDEWKDAYHDRPAGVVKIRPPEAGAGVLKVWLKTNGVISDAGTIRL